MFVSLRPLCDDNCGGDRGIADDVTTFRRAERAVVPDHAGCACHFLTVQRCFGNFWPTSLSMAVVVCFIGNIEFLPLNVILRQSLKLTYHPMGHGQLVIPLDPSLSLAILAQRHRQNQHPVVV